MVAEMVEQERTRAVPLVAPKMAPADTVSTKAAATGMTYSTRSRGGSRCSRGATRGAAQPAGQGTWKVTIMAAKAA
jgi:hypothetical protein